MAAISVQPEAVKCQPHSEVGDLLLVGRIFWLEHSMTGLSFLGVGGVAELEARFGTEADRVPNPGGS